MAFHMGAPGQAIPLCFVPCEPQVGAAFAVCGRFGWMLRVVEDVHLRVDCLGGNEEVILGHVPSPADQQCRSHARTMQRAGSSLHVQVAKVETSNRVQSVIWMSSSGTGCGGRSLDKTDMHYLHIFHRRRHGGHLDAKESAPSSLCFL